MIETSYSNATATIDGTRVTVRHDPAVCAVNESFVKTHDPAIGATVDSGPAASGRQPVAWNGVFSGPWQTGDRDPSDTEQIMHPDWFKDYPGKADNPTYSTSGDTEALTVAFVLGGTTDIGNDGAAPSNRKRRVVGCRAGPTRLLIGKFGAGEQVAVNIVSVGDVANVTGHFAVSPFPGVTMGPSVIQELTGNTATLGFTIGERLNDWAVAPADTDLYVNVDFTSVNSEIFVQVAAYK